MKLVLAAALCLGAASCDRSAQNADGATKPGEVGVAAAPAEGGLADTGQDTGAAGAPADVGGAGELTDSGRPEAPSQ